MLIPMVMELMISTIIFQMKFGIQMIQNLLLGLKIPMKMVYLMNMKILLAQALQIPILTVMVFWMGNAILQSGLKFKINRVMFGMNKIGENALGLIKPMEI